MLQLKFTETSVGRNLITAQVLHKQNTSRLITYFKVNDTLLKELCNVDFQVFWSKLPQIRTN